MPSDSTQLIMRTSLSLTYTRRRWKMNENYHEKCQLNAIIFTQSAHFEFYSIQFLIIESLLVLLIITSRSPSPLGRLAWL